MATGVQISSFAYVGAPTLSAIFGFFKSSSGTQIQRLQITAQIPPVGGNVTIQLVDESGNAYSGATVTLPSGTAYYDQPLAAPITLGLGKTVRAQITAVDIGVATDLLVNLIGATAQGANPPSGACGPASCQPPTASLLFFQGSVQPQVEQAQAAADAAAASATGAANDLLGTNTALAAAIVAQTGAETAKTNAEAQVTLAAGYATNANNAASAASVYAGQASASKADAAVFAANAQASALAAAAGPKCGTLELTAGSTQTIPDAMPTAVQWNNTQFDDLVFWSAGNPTRITIPVGSGIQRVRLSAGIRWAASAVGNRKLKIRSNPVGIYAANSIWGSDVRSAGDSGDATVETPILIVEEGMYFEVLVEQNSGGGLDIDTSTGAGNHGNFFTIEVLMRTP